jgi:hypothetical protein
LLVGITLNDVAHYILTKEEYFNLLLILSGKGCDPVLIMLKFVPNAVEPMISYWKSNSSKLAEGILSCIHRAICKLTRVRCCNNFHKSISAYLIPFVFAVSMVFVTLSTMISIFSCISGSIVARYRIAKAGDTTLLLVLWKALSMVSWIVGLLSTA